jgi:hypothetical protein
MTAESSSIGERGFILTSDEALNDFITQMKAASIRGKNLYIHLAIPTLVQKSLDDLFDAVSAHSDDRFIAKLDVFGGQIYRLATPWVKAVRCCHCPELETVFLTGTETALIEDCPKLESVGLLRVTELCLRHVSRLKYLEAPLVTECGPMSAISWFNNLVVLKIPAYGKGINLEHHRQLQQLDARGASDVRGLRHARSDLRMIPPQRRRIPKPRDVACAVSMVAIALFCVLFWMYNDNVRRIPLLVLPLFGFGVAAVVVAYRSIANDIIPSYKRLHY